MGFIKAVLKWLAALVVAYGVLFAFLFVLLMGLALSFEQDVAKVESDSILVMDLGFNLTDQPPEEDPARIAQSAFSGSVTDSLSLRTVVETLKRAAEDSRINGVLLTGSLSDADEGASLASLMEVRRALQEVALKKPVWAYLDGDSMWDIYLKSAAQKVYANPYGTLDFRGLRAEVMYLGEAFERVGIEVQVEAFEEYKSAAESFQKGRMSAPNREQLSDLMADVWAVILQQIADSRDMNPDALDGVASTDIMPMGSELVDYGFADELLTTTELIKLMSEESSYDSDAKTFNQIGLPAYVSSEQPNFMELMGSNSKVAIIYAEGGLIDGEGDRTVIGADRVVRDLRQLREDDSVKAIVLRVNSPGGSATGAFKVARELAKTNAVKPVVASMGGMAASAGYMISTPCEEIMAEPTTITGSIGVVMMLANAERLAEKLSINFETVQTHPFAGTFSVAHSKTDEEMAQFREIGADFYDEFLALVADTRGLEIERVRELARGRIWSGLRALDLGLVDRHGGLLQAVQRAADLAGIGDDFQIEERPRARTLEEQIEELFGVSARSLIPWSKRSPVGEFIESTYEELNRLALLNDPYGQYAILPYTLNIR